MSPRFLVATLLIIASVGLMPIATMAQLPVSGQAGTQTGQPKPTNTNSETVTLSNPLNTDSVPALIGRIINTVLGIVGSLAFLMFIWGGFNWLISGGSSARIEKGKHAVVYSSIGLVIVFSSYAIVRFILSAFTTL